MVQGENGVTVVTTNGNLKRRGLLPGLGTGTAGDPHKALIFFLRDH